MRSDAHTDPALAPMPSPWRAVAMVVAITALAEFSLMELLHSFLRLSQLSESLLDSALLALLLTPMVSGLLYRPYARHLAVHRALQDRLAAERAQAQGVIDAAADGLLATDGAGRVSLVNGRAAQLLGVEASRAQGRPLAELVELVDDPSGPRDDSTTEGEGRPTALMGRCIRPDGTVRLLEVTLGEAAGAGHRVYVLRDVTRRRQQEQAKQTTERLQMIGQVTGGIAHDFNNLLQVIRSHTYFAQVASEGDEDLTQDLQTALDACDRAGELTRQLLALGKSSTFDATVTDIGALVNELSPLLRAVLTERVGLRLEVDDNLPAVQCDRAQMHQVLLNLVVNARDAMVDGGTVTVRVTVQQRGTGDQWVVLEVIDSGVGISEEQVHRVWEPFFTTKTVGVGTGLGLSTVRTVVASLGGEASLESVEGRGTTVRIALPASGAHPSQEVQLVASSVELRGCRILVVEDEEGVRSFLRRVLEGEGATVVEAGDGASALERVRSGERFDLAVLDVVMPGTDGCGLRMALRELLPELRWLDVSGYDPRSLGTVCPAPKLIKPFSHERLLEVVAAVLAAEPVQACRVENAAQPCRTGGSA